MFKRNNPIRKILMGISLIFFLGILLTNSSIYGTAELLELSQPPNNVPKPGIPFEVPGNGSSVVVTPGERVVLTTPSGVSVNVSVANNVSITVNETTFNPVVDIPSNKSSLGKYLQIELDEETEIDAVLSMSFEDGDLPPGAAEDQLFFAFYNASLGTWEGVPSWVDTEKNIVYGQTNHFSTWTVLTDTDADPTTTSPTSSLWANLQNVKDGFVIIASVLTVTLVSVVVVLRRQK